jgi:RNA-directed DNA polymerase
LYLKALLLSKNLELNKNKIKIMPRCNSQIVTGIVVNEKAQVPRKIRQKLRQELYYIERFGISGHLAHKGIEDKKYLKHLYGKVGFVTYINPIDKEFVNYKRTLKHHIAKEKVMLEE